jgi:hypothetical protein
MCGLNLATPQVCGSDTLFRTSLLEKRSRSDRALKAAIASMYLQGVNTRRVTTVMGELCGFEVSSTPVSKLTAELDGEFEKSRNRPLSEISHFFAAATYYKIRIDRTSATTPTSLRESIRCARLHYLPAVLMWGIYFKLRSFPTTQNTASRIAAIHRR